MNIPASKPQIPPSPEQSQSPSKESKQENGTEKSTAVMDGISPPIPNPPAIIVSAETSPPMSIRSAEKRRQSWIAGRYKMFNMATDDLLKNTPGKLKSFFHRALRIHTNFDPAKPKKVKDSAKQRSASQLKRYSLISSDQNGSLPVPDENYKHVSSGSSRPNSPSRNASRFLRKKSSEQDLTCNFSLDEDSVDGKYSPRSVHSDTAFSFASNSQPPSRNTLEVSHSCPPSSQNPSVSNSPVLQGLDKTNRPQCQSTPVFNGLNPESLSRRTASHRECEMNNAHSTPDAHIEEEGKLKHRKSPFWIFKWKGSKCKESQ